MTAAHPDDYGALARETADTAEDLLALADTMDALSFHADGLPPARLREVANTLRGAALRAAMAAGDTALLNDLTGRTWTALHDREETTWPSTTSTCRPTRTCRPARRAAAG